MQKSFFNFIQYSISTELFFSESPSYLGFTVSIAGGMKPATLSLEPFQYEEFSDLQQLFQTTVDFSSILTFFFASNVC